MLCNQTVQMGEFSQSGSSNQSGTTLAGIQWFRFATMRDTDLGFSHYRDGVHHMGLTVPQQCYSDGLLEIKFNVTIDGGYELASAGIDNLNVTAFLIPPEQTDAPTMAPTQYVSPPPTKPLDICITDTMYDYKTRTTVHRKCVDLVAHNNMEMVEDSQSVIGQACIEAIDNEALRLAVRHYGKWDLQEAFAWVGESLEDAPRLNQSEKLDFGAFPFVREWEEGEGGEWNTTIPLLNTEEHCSHGIGEWVNVLVVQALVGAGPGNENETMHFQAWPREHYQQSGDFYWVHVGYTCHCDRTVEEEPPPTGGPTSAPSFLPTLLPTLSPSEPPSKIPTTSVPTMEDYGDSGVGRCVGSVDGSGRECHPLIGINKEMFGEVCVALTQDTEDLDDILNVTFTTKEAYRLTRNYLWIGEAGSRVPMLPRELDQPVPNLEVFPHFSCNWLGTMKWEKIINLGNRCHSSPEGSVLQMALVAHSEVATATSDGTVALNTIGTPSFAAEHTHGTFGEDSWFEVINFKILYLPSAAPTNVPSLLPSVSPSQSPTQIPSAVPSSNAPSQAPTFECRPAWAVKEEAAHCFKSIESLRTENQTGPYGFYNGLFDLKDDYELTLYVENNKRDDLDNMNETATAIGDCRLGEDVGSVLFSSSGKVVSVAVETKPNFYITESQAYVGPNLLPMDEPDGTYITDPSKFELRQGDLKEGTTKVVHYLRGCQEQNWVSTRAVVCGSFMG